MVEGDEMTLVIAALCVAWIAAVAYWCGYEQGRKDNLVHVVFRSPRGVLRRPCGLTGKGGD